MRLARGAGVRGLAAIRPAATVPGSGLRLIRPLLGWRRAELEQICRERGSPPRARSEQRGRTVRARPHPPGARAKPTGSTRKSLAASAANLRRCRCRARMGHRAGMGARGQRGGGRRSCTAAAMPLRNPPPHRCARRLAPRHRRRGRRPCAAASSTGCCRSSPAVENRPFAESSAAAEKRGASLRRRTGLDLWISCVKFPFNDSGESALHQGRGDVESDIRFFRRRASEELAAANRAVTESARERRMILAGIFLDTTEGAGPQRRETPSPPGNNVAPSIGRTTNRPSAPDVYATSRAHC